MPATVWKGQISFGLVSFPVRLHSAARKEAVRFHMLHAKDLSRVKEVWYCAEENKRIERDDIVKGFETSKGEYTVVEDEELKKMAPATATTMEILQFVRAEDVDPIYFETSYYVAPEGKVEKPYSLFAAVLEKTGQSAVAKVAMHNREHVVLIRAAEGSLVLHTLFYPHEMHEANRQAPPKAKYSAAELAMAKKLVEQLAAPFRPEEFQDEYRENVLRLVRAKAKGKQVKPVEHPKPGKVVDILDALKKSLAAHRPKSRGRGRKAA